MPTVKPRKKRKYIRKPKEGAPELSQAEQFGKDLAQAIIDKPKGVGDFEDSPPPPPVYDEKKVLDEIIPERAYASIENYNPENRCQCELVYPEKIRARWVAKKEARIEQHKMMGYWMARPKIDVKWHTGVYHIDGTITDVDSVLMCCPLEEHVARDAKKKAEARSREKSRQEGFRAEGEYVDTPGQNYRESKSGSRFMKEKLP